MSGLGQGFKGYKMMVGVHGFKGSRVQGSILVAGLHSGCVFTRKASASSALIQNMAQNWQLFGKMGIFYREFLVFDAFMSLTLNVEP
jgi:hypothetical protein